MWRRTRLPSAFHRHDDVHRFEPDKPVTDTTCVDLGMSSDCTRDAPHKKGGERRRMRVLP
jgi:hypothetical protein